MKAFFKPTISKIVVTLVLPFYFGVIASVYLDINLKVMVEQQLSVAFIPYIVLVFGTMYLWSASESFFDNIAVLNTGQMIWYFFLEIILPLIINYLLACLLVYLYHRFRDWKKIMSPARQSNSNKPAKNNTK